MAAKMASLALVCVVIAAMCGVNMAHGASNAAAAPSSADCSTLVLSMVDCLSYVTNDSTTEAPEGNCCSGLKSVLKTAPNCLCEVFKNSAQFGITLNETKAMNLPAACKVPASSAPDCGLKKAPVGGGGAPVGGAPPADTKAPGGSTGSTSVASPAPSASTPANAASAMFPISTGSLLLCLLVAVFSAF